MEPQPGRIRADPVPAPLRPEEIANPEVNSYLTGLDYDPRQILAARVNTTSLPARALPDEKHDNGKAIVIVKHVKHRLEGNLDDQVIRYRFRLHVAVHCS